MKDALLFALLGVLAWRGVQGGAIPEPPADEPIQWDNEPDGELNVDCPCGYGLFKVRSEFYDTHNDRRWLWQCREVRASVFTITFILYACNFYVIIII